MATGSFWDPMLITRVRMLSREPFQDELAKWLAAGPTPEHVRAFATKSPDRWAQGVAILVKASGFSDRQEIQVEGLGGLVRELLGLSDAELFAKYGGIGAALPPDAAPPKALASGSTPGDFR